MRSAARHILRHRNALLGNGCTVVIVAALLLSAFVPLWHVPLSLRGCAAQELQTLKPDLSLAATILEKLKQDDNRLSAHHLLLRAVRETGRSAQSGRTLPLEPESPPTLASLLVYSQTTSTSL